MNTSNLLESWKNFLLEESSILPRRVIVACSGGVDSMVLLDLMHRLRLHVLPDLALEVAHVNYGLRAQESDGDEALVRLQAERFGYLCHVRRATEPPDQGIQEWARRIRREFFESLLASGGGLIAVAHQRDDLAENALLRMSRGCGFDIAGMSAFDPPYWRPLLGQSRRDLQEWAGRQKVPYREDESNAKLIYSRNKIRHEVIPRLEDIYSGASGRIASLAMDLRDLESYLQIQFAPLIAADRLPYKALHGVPESVALSVIARFIKQHAGVLQLSRRLLRRVLAKMADLVEESSQAWSEDLPGSKRLRVDCQGLKLVDKSASFSLRARQHRANIRSLQMPAQLEDGASLELLDAKQDRC